MKCPGDGEAQMLAHGETDELGQEEVLVQAQNQVLERTQERVLEQEQMWAPEQNQVFVQAQNQVLEQKQMTAQVSEQAQTPGGMRVSPGDGVCECGKVTSDKGERELVTSQRELLTSDKGERELVTSQRELVISERGMVTSEIAIGLIPISFIAILLMVITSFMTAYLQAQSVSYAVARNVAIGKSYDASALEVSGANRASIEVAGAGEYVVVTSSVEPFGVLGWLDVRASSTISIPLEPGVSLP